MADGNSDCTMADGNSDVSNNDLKQFIMQMKEDIMSKLDQNQRDIREIREELRNMKTTVSDVEKATCNHAQRLDDIEKKTIPEVKSTMAKTVSQLEEKLLLLEIHDRKSNLLVYGVEEKKDEDIKTDILDVWHHNFSVSDEQLDRGTVMTDCHRLPQSQYAKPNKDGKMPPRPIIVRFAYKSDRDFFLNSKNMKRGSKIRVLEDLPPVMKRERGRLASVAYQLRKERQVMTRISVRRTNVVLEYKEKNKPDASWLKYREGQ